MGRTSMPHNRASGHRGGDLDGPLLAVAIDDAVPDDLFLGLGEGTVRHGRDAVAHPYRRGGGRVGEPFAANPFAGSDELVHDGPCLVHQGMPR